MSKEIYIKQGHHYSNEWVKPILWCKGYERNETRTYIFDESCRYLIGSDQSDKNKLFGWSYGFHHKNSVRVSWWYSPDDDRIVIGLYTYNDGEVSKKKLSNVEIGKPIELTLSTRVDYTDLIVCELSDGNRKINSYIYKNNLSRWGYTLTTYFGGNKTAPHKITMRYA